MSDPIGVVVERRGRRFVAPGFVAAVCAAAIVRVVFGGSRSTATVVATGLIGVVGALALAFCVWLAVAGRARVEVASGAVQRVAGRSGGVAVHAVIDGPGELILRIVPTAFSRKGGRQYTWELATTDGAQRIDLIHIDPRAVAAACRAAGWTVTEPTAPPRG